MPFGSRNHYRRRLSNLKKGFSLSSILNQTPFLIQPTSRFSSAGRGRGRGSGFPAAGKGQFGINSEPEIAKVPVARGRGSSESQSPGGYGHDRGRPIQSDLNPPPFTAFVRPDSTSLGRGRGSLGSDPVSPFSPAPPRHPSQMQQPRFQPPPSDDSRRPQLSREEQLQQPAESKNVSNALGSGEGPFVEAAPPQQQENRDIRRPQPPPQRQRRVQPPKDETPRPQLSPEEAGRRARSQLSHGEAEGSGGVRGRGRGRGRGGGGEAWRDDKKEEEADKRL